MPVCEGCGNDFGNEGALASHRPHCNGNPDAVGEPRTPREEAPTRPAPAEPGGRDVPARHGEFDAFDLAVEAGDELAALEEASPERRAQAQGRLGELLGGAVQGFFRRKAQNTLDGLRRAKEHDGDIQVAGEYPRCPECDHQLRRLPRRGEEFRCDRCGEALVA